MASPARRRTHAAGRGRLRDYRQMMTTAAAKEIWATTRPRETHLLDAATVLGIVNRWMTIHRATARPNTSLMRSPRVSCTDQRVSLWGVLTRTVIATSAPTNSALRVMADTRRPIGILVLPSSSIEE